MDELRNAIIDVQLAGAKLQAACDKMDAAIAECEALVSKTLALFDSKGGAQ